MPEEQLGRPESLSITSPALTINDITDWNFSPDVDLNERISGKKRYPRITVGAGKERLTIKTSDMAAFMALTKGMECGTVVLTIEAPVAQTAAGSNTVALQHAKKLVCTISTARVYEAKEISGNAEGAPAEFELVFAPALKEADGASPTVSWAFAGGGGGS